MKLRKGIAQYFSSVDTALKKKVLLRGTFVALIGLIPLLFAAVYLPREVLTKFGIWVFIFWALMTTLGLLPYKRLLEVEKEPHILTVSNKEFVVAFHGKQPFEIPKKQVEAISFLKGKNGYGIVLELKEALPSGRTKLYLPYFSERSFKSLFEQCHGDG